MKFSLFFWWGALHLYSEDILVATTTSSASLPIASFLSLDGSNKRHILPFIPPRHHHHQWWGLTMTTIKHQPSNKKTHFRACLMLSSPSFLDFHAVLCGKYMKISWILGGRWVETQRRNWLESGMAFRHLEAIARVWQFDLVCGRPQWWFKKERKLKIKFNKFLSETEVEEIWFLWF